jgi:CheY-like chemotaxis protein
VQLDGGLSRKYEGSGLGLVLVRRLTELHGGGVEVHSSPGKGSRFTVNLPWEQTAGGRKATEHPVTGGETVTTAGGPWLTDILPTVLIVEDDDRTLAVLTEYFRSHRCQILIARTALEALRMIGVQRLDLVLMDIQMPAIDGHAVIQLVREVEERLGHARIPVYAVSSLSLPGDRDRWIAAGASDLFYKPVSLAALSRQLQAHEGSLV